MVGVTGAGGLGAGRAPLISMSCVCGAVLASAWVAICGSAIAKGSVGIQGVGRLGVPGSSRGLRGWSRIGCAAVGVRALDLGLSPVYASRAVGACLSLTSHAICSCGIGAAIQTSRLVCLRLNPCLPLHPGLKGKVSEQPLSYVTRNGKGVYQLTKKKINGAWVPLGEYTGTHSLPEILPLIIG